MRRRDSARGASGSRHARGEKTHEVLDEIVHVLVVVPEPRAGIRTGPVHVQQIAERHGASDTHVESRDVAVVAGRQERRECFDRGVCEKRVRRREQSKTNT